MPVCVVCTGKGKKKKKKQTNRLLVAEWAWADCGKECTLGRQEEKCCRKSKRRKSSPLPLGQVNSREVGGQKGEGEKQRAFWQALLF